MLCCGRPLTERAHLLFAFDFLCAALASGDLSVEAQFDTLNSMWEAHPDRDMTEEEAQSKSEAGLLQRF